MMMHLAQEQAQFRKTYTFVLLLRFRIFNIITIKKSGDWFSKQLSFIEIMC